MIKRKSLHRVFTCLLKRQKCVRRNRYREIESVTKRKTEHLCDLRVCVTYE